MPSLFSRQRTYTLTVDAVSGHFSPRGVLRSDDTTAPDCVGRATVNIISAPAGASIVVDLLKPQGVAATDGDWRTDLDENSGVGLLAAQNFNLARGVGFRGKSGGAAGDVVIDVTWEALA